VTNGLIVRRVQKKDFGVPAKLMTEPGYPTSTEDMARCLAEIYESADPA
jgi:hypothetical protein